MLVITISTIDAQFAALLLFATDPQIPFEEVFLAVAVVSGTPWLVLT